MQPEEVEKTIKSWYSHLGRKGGSSRSDKKLKAAKEQLKKARLSRWPNQPKGDGK